MIMRVHTSALAQRGIVLISAMLLLLVVTIIALSMFRSFGMQEKIAGNMREKQRALQAAISAEQFAESWLSSPVGSGSVPIVCNNALNANLNQGQICSNKLPIVVANNDVTAVPWKIGAAFVGVDFTPPNMQISPTTSVSAASVANPTYFAPPRFYISDMGTSADPGIAGEVYQIDAVGYGGALNTAAVVESTYAVYNPFKCPSCQP
jgi:type IV pilus assembly protein PilX